MSTIDRICRLYARQIELRQETSQRYLTTRELDELSTIETELHERLWPRRQRELAQASEAARQKAEAAMRYGRQGNQGKRTDLMEVGHGAD